MKERFSKGVILFFLACSFLGFSQIGAVNWHGGVITNDVVNDNISLMGINQLENGIHVEASTANVVITVNSDSVITGDNVGESQLYLSVAQTQTITFSVINDLAFKGSANFDLLVSVTGGGTVEFEIDDNKKVSFTSDPNTGGAKFFVGMDVAPNDPKIIFKRLNQASANNVEVVVGAKSGITYMAESALSVSSTERGTMRFYTTNSGTGCMILRLQDSSYFVIYGHWLNKTYTNDFVLSDIDLKTPAGLKAFFVIRNEFSNSSGLLQVVNENTRLTNYLADPFCDGSFVVTGTQFGFILGANAILTIERHSYLDYIGTVTNDVPTVYTPLSAVQEDVIDQIECMKISGVQDLIKERNASAFIVDGNPDPNALPAKIELLTDSEEEASAIYFRTAADCNGDVVPSYTVDPDQQCAGAGCIVFDVEGKLNVQGRSRDNTGLSILSLQVDKTGCPVTVESRGPSIFPKRTFAKDANGEYLQYGRAAWLINNRMNMFDTSLIHTDEAHDVFERNNLGRSDLSSEPTYIGGETFTICKGTCPIPRPSIAFLFSIFRVHSNVASTGVDYRVPNCDSEPSLCVSSGNTSIFRFYNNGRCIDNAYGRVMVLGTDVGSFSNCGQKIDDASHLDVFQETNESPVQTQLLDLQVGSNDICITESLTDNIDGECSVHTLFLNNASNISIGTNADTGTNPFDCTSFTLTTFPMVRINGEFFSFETAGGLWCLPEASGTTGQGGIFVDKNGTFQVVPRKRASISTMVVKSRNGVIDLPRSQVFFDTRVGVSQWKINLTQSTDRVLVPDGTVLSDFTMDWGAVEKDYCTTDSFVPYEPKQTPNACDSPVVTNENLRALPVVEGAVDQFQIKRSRIGDQAHLQVKGGHIRELVMLSGNNSAEAPVGFIVVEDNALVGLGTAHRNVDSLEASVKLGINGITLCANGDATIEINENLLVDNVCHIVTGTSFGVGAVTNKLMLHSHDTKEFRIKSTGLLDLSQFDTANKQIEFGGNLILVFEPGSRLVLGGGTLIFTDEAQVTFERVLNKNLLSGSFPSDLDDIRVKILGTGKFIFNEHARMKVVHDQFVGIEADTECSLNTSFTWELNNQAKIQIGTDSEPGGAFQIGNTTDVTDATIDFTLILKGVGTLFEINRQGFVGFGVGIADKAIQAPNEWFVNCLEDVTDIKIDIQEGTFRHNQIRRGNVITAALLAIGPACSYSLSFNLLRSVILGGGNFVLLENCISPECVRLPGDQRALESWNPESRAAAIKAQEIMDKAEEMMQQAKTMMLKITRGDSERNAKTMHDACRLMNDGKCMQTRARKMVRTITLSPSIHPTVLDTAGQIDSNLEVGIMSGKLLLRLPEKGTQPAGVTPQAFFDYLKTLAITSQSSPRANIFRDQVEESTLGYISGSTIVRLDTHQRILGSGGEGSVDHDHSLRIGAVQVHLDDSSNDPIDVIEIRGSDGF